MDPMLSRVAQFYRRYTEVAKKKEPGMTATAENTELETQETAGETLETTQTEPEVVIDGIPVSEMSPEQILAAVNRRREEYQAATKVAKEKGLVVAKEKKARVDDVDQLARLVNRVGYSAGMRLWADQRMNKEGTRVQAVVDKLGDAFQDPERMDELCQALAEGYREAKVQTSFQSAAMATKEAAKNAPVSEILPEALEAVSDKGWGFLGTLRNQ